MKKIFTVLACCAALLAHSQKQTFLLVGAYTGGKSKGISVFLFDTRNGSATIVDTVATPNPSYLAVSPDNKYVYAVNELGNKEGGGKVSAFRFDSDKGQLQPLNQQTSMGEHPCYITVDKTGKWVIVGNYTGGNVAVLPVKEGGELAAPVTAVQHQGLGSHSRQEKPHVHSTVLSPNNKYLYVPDLGKDKVMIYAFNSKTGALQPKDTTLALNAGSGPRHFVFHPNKKWAYLVQELAGTVTAFKYHRGDLKPTQTISVLPAGFSKPFTSADIHVSPDGNFLYTSTRDEANLISIFQVNKKNGQLTLIGHESTGGKTPRNFNFDPSGKFLLVANQNSDDIVVFSVDRKSGMLKDTGHRISVGNPVCLKWIAN